MCGEPHLLKAECGGVGVKAEIQPRTPMVLVTRRRDAQSSPSTERLTEAGREGKCAAIVFPDWLLLLAF